MVHRRAALLVTVSALVLLSGAQAASAQSIEPSVFDGDVADLPRVTGSTGPAPPEGRVPGSPADDGVDGVDGEGSARRPGDAADTDASAPIVSFEGLRMTSGAPPDPTGEIGPNHFVEAINSTPIQIFNRSGATVAGPFQLSSLFTGGLCGIRDDGDPIVMYDQLHDRWLLAQFAVPNPYAMCIAISQTGDPTGGYFAYEFPMAEFPDYEKFGIWGDGLYMTTFEGPNNGAFAFDYATMRAGGVVAPPIKRVVPSADQVRGTRLLPADIDGEVVNPAGAPNVIVQTVDGELTSAAGDVDRIEIFEFRADFATPASSTVTEVAELPTAPFDNSMCYGTTVLPHRDCIPQFGTATRLDPLSHRPMWRASYRNYGSHESLVFNQTVDATGTDIAGIRWYELRRSGGGQWAIFQQGTFSPDTTHRWMGSAALNRVGEIGLGYSASSSSIFPGLRYAARSVNDPLGQLGPEQVLVDGPEAQTTSNRWGDYSHMSIDPLDDCTMWFVGEYGNRRSRVGSFQVTDCLPETTIASGPSGVINDSTPTYTLSGDEPRLSFECSVDGGGFAPCPANFTPTLGDGPHTISARAVAKGSVDPTPATHSITIDTKAPAAKIAKRAKLKNNKLAVKIKCKDAEECEGRLDVKKDKRPKRVSVDGRDKETVKVKVKPSVDPGDKLKATLTLADAVGNTAKIKKKLTVK